MKGASLFTHNIQKHAARIVNVRRFVVGAAKAKKGPKGGAGDAPKASALTQEQKAMTMFGANILKEGTYPKILADSEYPDLLWHMLDKRRPLSELQRKDAQTLAFGDLKRFVKLDNHSRIKENNAARAKH